MTVLSCLSVQSVESVSIITEGKGKKESEVAQGLTLCDSMEDSPPDSSSLEFSRHGLPFPSPGDPPYPGIEPSSPALQADYLPSEPPGSPKERERLD